VKSKQYSIFLRSLIVLVLALITLISLIVYTLPYFPVQAQTTTGQFKTYNEQYGRFSIVVPKDWLVGYPSIKQDSVTVDFSPNNKDDILFIIASMDRRETASQTDFEQVIKEQNADTVRSLPGATLIQDTDCTKYVIDGKKACSVIYSVTKDNYTQKEMDVDFQTGKQSVSISVQGSDFDKYLPVADQMLNSMKVS
jgi:hypothetical protein